MVDHHRKPPKFVETQMIRLRQRVGQTGPGRALKRLLGRELTIPPRTEPGPSGLRVYDGDAELPPELRDNRILTDAVAWQQERRLRDPETRPAAGRNVMPAPESFEEAGTLGNVVFVSHCDFTGNSALHVYAIAQELYRRGASPIIAVPEDPGSVDDVGRPPFPVLTYAEAIAGPLVFPDGRGPDLIHAFSPRELVREATVSLVEAHGCRYLVHLEDNDEVVLSGELGGADLQTLFALPLPVLDRLIQPRQSHPLRGARFLEQAAGITVLVDRLLELVPAGVPAVVLHAGFDEAVLTPRRDRDTVRTEIGLEPDELAIVYTGNVHALNRDEMRELYAAVGLLRQQGRRVVLVKTGWGSGVAATFPSLGAGIRDLGWVSRGEIPELLAAADVLVQPGGPNPFNDYRFPSKLPEYLASGRPVVLPKTNVGLELRDGQDALLLQRGDADEIAEAVARLSDDAALRERLGEAGRAFALRELRWPASVDKLEALAAVIPAVGRAPAPAWALQGADPPVRLIAIVSELPDRAEVEDLRSNGVFGLCLSWSAVASFPQPAMPLCLRLDGDSPAELSAALEFSVAFGLRVDGAPLLLCDEKNTDVARSLASVLPVRITLATTAATSPTNVGDTWAIGATALDTSDASAMAAAVAPLPDGVRFATLLAPVEDAVLPTYATWLRKLTLKAALRAPAQPSLLFVDATRGWSDARARAAWLTATRVGLREGVRQFYASQSLSVSEDEAELILRST